MRFDDRFKMMPNGMMHMPEGMFMMMPEQGPGGRHMMAPIPLGMSMAMPMAMPSPMGMPMQQVPAPCPGAPGPSSIAASVSSKPSGSTSTCSANDYEVQENVSGVAVAYYTAEDIKVGVLHFYELNLGVDLVFSNI